MLCYTKVFSAKDKNKKKTRMHSSRMRTARSSSRAGGLHQAPPQDQPPRACTLPWKQAPLEQVPPWNRHPPGPDPPGAGTLPGAGTPPGSRHPPGAGTPRGAGTPPQEQAPPGAGTPPGPDHPLIPEKAPSPRGQTHTCKHITLPQTSSAGGKKTWRIRSGTWPR